MNGDMTERIALITGAARGIGLAIARALVGRGARVALVDMDPGALVGAAGSLGSAALPITADVSQAEEVRVAVQTAVQHFGGLDILVNNAGICPMTPFEEIGEEEWDRVLAVNLKSAFLCCQAALPHVRHAGKRGRIISIASIAGQMGGVSVAPHYAVSKAGLIALTKALAQRVAADGATVNCVAPGTVVTDMTASWSDADMARVTTRIPLGRLGRPEEIAEAVCYLASDSAAFITGATLDINGGIYLR
jgi:3-oxoacyl-[acyl-carrier protein] reductase